MDLNRLITMITNIFIRKAVNTGINKGLSYAARRGKSQAQMTPAQTAQANDARALAKKARQAARITRRLGR